MSDEATFGTFPAQTGHTYYSTSTAYAACQFRSVPTKRIRLPHWTDPSTSRGCSLSIRLRCVFFFCLILREALLGLHMITTLVEKALLQGSGDCRAAVVANLNKLLSVLESLYLFPDGAMSTTYRRTTSAAPGHCYLGMLRMSRSRS